MVKERQVKDTDKKELDIYGRNFIERIGRTSMKVREKYLNQISSSMKGAI